MDVISFIWLFITTVFFNETPSAGIDLREYPRMHERDLLALLALLISCLFFAALSIKFCLEKEIEIAPNHNADFLENINFTGKIPSEFVCSITQCIMQDPVRILRGHEGHVFERTAFEKWINEGRNSNPLSGELLPPSVDLVPAHDIAKKIQTWMSDLRFRRYVFSIFSRKKIDEEKSSTLSA